MALFTPSSTISEIRGSIGSNVYSRNRYRNIIRNRTTPANPNTSHQIAVRANMSAAVAAWQALSTANKLKFEVAAENWYTHSTIDGKKKLTGYAYYVKAFLLQAATTIGTVNSNYIPRPMPRMVINSIDVQEDRIEIDFDMIESVTSWWIYPRLCVPVSPGILSVNQSSMVPMGAIAIDAGNNFIDLIGNYDSRFGTDLTGMIGKAIFIDMDIYDTLNQVIHKGIRSRVLVT